MRRGSEYVESLRDGRAVFLDGERVGDVTKHPAFAEPIRRANDRVYGHLGNGRLRHRLGWRLLRWSIACCTKQRTATTCKAEARKAEYNSQRHR